MLSLSLSLSSIYLYLSLSYPHSHSYGDCCMGFVASVTRLVQRERERENKEERGGEVRGCIKRLLKNAKGGKSKVDLPNPQRVRFEPHKSMK